MVLSIIEDYKELYKQSLLNESNPNDFHQWEMLKQFQDNWDLNAEDFGAMYDASFSSDFLSSLSLADVSSPKEIMLEFIKLDQERVRTMFLELHNEDLIIDNRIISFVNQCNKMIVLLAKTNPEMQNHFHDGFRMISVYLCFRHPENYTIFKDKEFKDFMKKIKAKTMPKTGDVVRFFKVMRTVYKIVSKDEEFLKTHRDIRADAKYYQEDSLLITHDFLMFCEQIKVAKGKK